MCFYCICVISVFLGLYLKLRSRDFAASRLLGYLSLFSVSIHDFPYLLCQLQKKANSAKYLVAAVVLIFFSSSVVSFPLSLWLSSYTANLIIVLSFPKAPWVNNNIYMVVELLQVFIDWHISALFQIVESFSSIAQGESLVFHIITSVHYFHEFPWGKL